MASDNDPASREVTLRGRSLSSIPCFRQTYLYGIGSGLAGGLATFMFTSRPRTATHAGFGTFFTVTLSYWFYCRYTWSTSSFQYRQMKHAMKNQVMTEGTAQDKGTGGGSSDVRPEVADA